MNFFEGNVKVLRERSPEAFEKILGQAKPPEKMEFFETPSGEPSARWEDRWLHSTRAPRQEAEGFIDLSPNPAPEITLMEGFGLGYHAEAFLARRETGQLWILEADVPLFLDALRARDLSSLLASPRVSFFLRPRPEDLVPLLADLSRSSLGILKIRSTYEKDREYYESADKAIHALFARQEVNQNTLKRFGHLWVRNLFRNLPLLPRARGLYRLEGLLEGLPALLLAAGPSLDEILPVLPELKNRFVLICVDTAYRAVKDAAGEPDFLVAVDPQYWNTRHLDGTSMEKTILISDSSSHPRIFRRASRAVYFCRSFFPLGRYLEEATDIRGSISAGGSVATFAWELARITGAEPIGCAGLDLAFPNGQTHKKESFFERQSLCTSRRTLPQEGQSFFLLNNADPYWIPDNSGGQVLSDQRMRIYHQWFEAQLGRPEAPKTCNLSPLGAAIKGMDYRPVAELLDFPCIRKTIDERLAPFQSRGPEEASGPAWQDNAKALTGKAESLRDSMDELIEKSRQALALVDQLENSLRDKACTRNITRELDKIDGEILDGIAGNIAGFLFESEIRKVVAENPAGSDEKAILNNSRDLYRRLLDSGLYHRKLLAENLKRLSSG